MGHMKDLDRRIRQGGDDAIAAVGELMPRWIPVGERLPEVYVWVLAWDGSPPVPCVCYLTPSGEWTTGRSIELTTHWMPLPEPPAS